MLLLLLISRRGGTAVMKDVKKHKRGVQEYLCLRLPLSRVALLM